MLRPTTRSGSSAAHFNERFAQQFRSKRSLRLARQGSFNTQSPHLQHAAGARHGFYGSGAVTRSTALDSHLVTATVMPYNLVGLVSRNPSRRLAPHTRMLSFHDARVTPGRSCHQQRQQQNSTYATRPGGWRHIRACHHSTTLVSRQDAPRRSYHVLSHSKTLVPHHLHIHLRCFHDRSSVRRASGAIAKRTRLSVRPSSNPICQLSTQKGERANAHAKS